MSGAGSSHDWNSFTEEDWNTITIAPALRSEPQKQTPPADENQRQGPVAGKSPRKNAPGNDNQPLKAKDTDVSPRRGGRQHPEDSSPATIGARKDGRAAELQGGREKKASVQPNATGQSLLIVDSGQVSFFLKGYRRA